VKKLEADGFWEYKNLITGFFSSLQESPPFGHLADIFIMIFKSQEGIQTDP